MIPIILFVYDRPDHLCQTLNALRVNSVPFIYAFSDGPRNSDSKSAVAEVRNILRAIDWCEIEICERDVNFGLGRSILSGVTEVLKKNDAAIIFEDDLVCVPGTYDYLCAALEHYRNDLRVMSVTAWTHPLVTPGDVIDQPYFDGRAECLVWGTWSRAWKGMDTTNANKLVKKCNLQGIDIYGYGADLVLMSKIEFQRNIWAVRFLYWHIINGCLCLRPPWSMVEHIGFDSNATNAHREAWFKNPPLKLCPPLPGYWPEPIEHSDCLKLWKQVCGKRPSLLKKVYIFVRRIISGVLYNYRKGRKS